MMLEHLILMKYREKRGVKNGLTTMVRRMVSGTVRWKPREFTELFETAKKEIDSNKTAQQVIVVRTAKNAEYSFLNNDIMSGNTMDEEQFAELLSGKEDTEITELLCMWNTYNPDIPSQNFRNLLVKINKENSKTKILLAGKDSYLVKEMSAIG